MRLWTGLVLAAISVAPAAAQTPQPPQSQLAVPTDPAKGGSIPPPPTGDAAIAKPPPAVETRTPILSAPNITKDGKPLISK